MLIALPCLLGACGASTPVDVPPPPAEMVSRCAAPLSLPARDATQAEVERWWGRDRAALRDCADRHAALSDWAANVTE